MTHPSTRRTAGPARPRPNRVAALVLLFAFVALMWVVEGVDVGIQSVTGGPGFDDDGVRPLSSTGLLGIVTMPFLHGSWAHLAGNSVALLVLGSLIALSGVRPLVVVTGVSWLLSGLVCWLIGGIGTVHIGASGIVFGYIFYVVARGVFTRRFWHLLVGLLVAGYYGLGALAGLSPLQEGVSWQGHLGGAIAGVTAAANSRRAKGVQAPPYTGAGPVSSGPRW